MQLETVVTQTSRLFNNYAVDLSPKYKEERVNFIYQELSNVQDLAFKMAVDDILKDESIKKFPTIAQIKAYIHKHTHYTEIQGCGKCEKGVISSWVYKDCMAKWYVYSFRCSCVAGKNLNLPDAPDIIYPVNRRHPEGIEASRNC